MWRRKVRLDQKLELRQQEFELDEVILGPTRPPVKIKLLNDQYGRVCISLRNGSRSVNLWLNPNGELTVAQETSGETLYLQENLDGTGRRFLPDRPYQGTGRKFTAIQTGLGPALFGDDYGDELDDPVRRMLADVPRAPTRVPAGRKHRVP